MNILLLSPSQATVYGKEMAPAYPPLGLLYIGTVLERDGHTVKLADIDTERIDETRLCAILSDFNPGAIGLTCVTPTYKNAIAWASVVKKHSPSIPIVLGGIHATLMPEEVVSSGSIDIAVIGEGEETAIELFAALSAGKSDLSSIPGLCFKQNGRTILNEKRRLINDLDSLPFPNRRLIANPGAFRPPDATCLPVATIMTSRGCPGRCSFCCSKEIFSRKFRPRSVESIVAEIEYLRYVEGFREIHIADDTFTLNRERTLRFCSEVHRRSLGVKFQFMNGLRADFVDEEILKALREIGVKSVGFGVESASQEILLNVGKNIPLKATKRALSLSKRLGFETWIFLMFGLPGETDATAAETIAFAKEVDPDFAKFLILKPYPGSPIHSELKNAGLLLNKDYDDYGVYTNPVHTLPGFGPERMLYWQKRAVREFYFRPRKLLSQAKRIKSWKQLTLAFTGFRFILHCALKKSNRVKPAPDPHATT